MDGLPRPAAGEHAGVLEFLRFNQNAFFAVAHGLTDEQARSAPAASTLSIGGLIKHVTSMQRSWLARVAAAPGAPPPDQRSVQERAAEYADEYVMHDDETLGELLAQLEDQNARTLRVLTEKDWETTVPVPRDAPWFPQDVDHWSVRWVVLHLIEELCRHAGHADIIRETIDGATMYELLAATQSARP